MFYKNLDKEKYKLVSWNEKMIPMELFLSFITVPLERSQNHLGSYNGWTKLFNKEHALEISGGVYKGKEWLADIQYGNRLGNAYNNYVNPFYLMDIMTNDGIAFFLDFYKEDIDKQQLELDKTVERYERLADSSRVLAAQNKLEVTNYRLKYFTHEPTNPAL